LTAFLSSGIVSRSAMLDAYAAGPSKTGHLPYWLDLDATIEQNYSNDDPADLSSPNKISMADLGYRKSYMNQSWSDMDLVNELIGADPMAQIKKRTSTYWLRRLQKRIIAISRGVMATNIASNASDMIIDISTQTGLSATAANRFSRDAFVRASFTMGDLVGGFVAIAMHSVVYAQLTTNDDIAFTKDSQDQLTVPYYMGRLVIVDDGMPVIAGTTNGFRYVSVLFGAGFIGMGVGRPEVPVETIRVPAAGHGGGMDTMHERKTWLLHPAGHNWVEGTLTEFSPRDSDLALAAHWTRAYGRKLIPVAFLITN
jgi:hypothetical protein